MCAPECVVCPRSTATRIADTCASLFTAGYPQQLGYGNNPSTEKQIVFKM